MSSWNNVIPKSDRFRQENAGHRVRLWGVVSSRHGPLRKPYDPQEVRSDRADVRCGALHGAGERSDWEAGLLIHRYVNELVRAEWRRAAVEAVSVKNEVISATWCDPVHQRFEAFGRCGGEVCGPVFKNALDSTPNRSTRSAKLSRFWSRSSSSSLLSKGSVALLSGRLSDPSRRLGLHRPLEKFWRNRGFATRNSTEELALESGTRRYDFPGSNQRA